MADLLWGLLLFLIALFAMRRGLQGMWGEKGGEVGLLQRLPRGRTSGFLVGLLGSALVHSSSAFLIAAVALAETGVLAGETLVALVLGANVGTTATLFALSLPRLPGPQAMYLAGAALVAAGTFLDRMGRRGDGRALAWGGVAVFAFGLLLEALELLARGAEAAGASPIARRLLHGSARGPWSATAVGVLLAATLQSSTATTALAAALVEEGLLPLEAAVGIALGTNVGTVADTLVAGALAGRAGRQVAYAHLLVNALGVLLAVPLVPVAAQWLASEGGTALGKLALVQGAFNFTSAAAFLPLATPIARVVARLP
ncbi:MAG: Sodium-dependent phosphate transporter [Brockia lithotrophica]|uniref:Sodium-dependent phosphate transporter n=1 Tax=Brockia lithotrophica TaxID=933949 RepID=A0A2T5G714_9BACL|nr:Na/Pi cotransporter family protein [Brockia lithotrophica]PTQ51981.1 MAG: Sodium-dependent phosphate transporter [Brockia lithotrophica]